MRKQTFTPGPIGGILRVAHRDRAAQLSVPLPDADHFESDDREALVDRVMGPRHQTSIA